MTGLLLRHSFVAFLLAAPAIAALVVLVGPVAGVVVTLYWALALAAAHRILSRRAEQRALTDLVDAVESTVGDLRAGIVPNADGLRERVRRVLNESWAADAPAVRAARDRLAWARRVSDTLGTPIVDVLERVEAELRAAQALRQSVDGQTSAAHATGITLMGLPLIGLFVGTAVGVDPLDRLLHTELGAACAIGGVALQSAGMYVTVRIVDSIAEEVRR